MIYLRPNNTFKYSTTMNNLEVGETNGYGYLVLGKYYLYNNCYLTKDSYYKALDNHFQKQKIKRERKEKIYKILEEIRNAL